MNRSRKIPEPGKYQVMVYNPIDALTGLEMIIGELLMEGFYARTVAWYLNMSENTLSNHLEIIYKILNINTMTEFATIVWWHLEGRFESGCQDFYQVQDYLDEGEG